MKTETKIKLRRALELIHTKCNHNGSSISDLVQICADEKLTRALPTFLSEVGVISKQGKLRVWTNEKGYSKDEIIERVISKQRACGRESTRRQRAKEILYGKKTGEKKPQPINLFKGDLFNGSTNGSVKSVSEFLHQLPIETIITHIQSKGFIVLKP